MSQQICFFVIGCQKLFVLLKIPCGKTAENLNERDIFFITFARLSPWQAHGEYRSLFI